MLNPAIGNPAIGNPAIGNPAIGNPAIGNPAIGNPAIGNPAIGNRDYTNKVRLRGLRILKPAQAGFVFASMCTAQVKICGCSRCSIVYNVCITYQECLYEPDNI